MQVASKQGSRACDSGVEVSSVARFFFGDGAKSLASWSDDFADSAVDESAESAFFHNVDLFMTTLFLGFRGATTLGNSLPESPSPSSPPLSSFKASSLSPPCGTSTVVVLFVCSSSIPLATSLSLLSASSPSAFCCCSCCFFLFSALIWSSVLILKSRLLVDDDDEAGGGCFLTKVRGGGGGRLALTG